MRLSNPLALQSAQKVSASRYLFSFTTIIIAAKQKKTIKLEKKRLSKYGGKPLSLLSNTSYFSSSTYIKDTNHALSVFNVVHFPVHSDKLCLLWPSRLPMGRVCHS